VSAEFIVFEVAIENISGMRNILRIYEVDALIENSNDIVRVRRLVKT